MKCKIQIGSLIQPCDENGKALSYGRNLPIAHGGPYDIVKTLVCRDGKIAYVVKPYSSCYFVPAYQITEFVKE